MELPNSTVATSFKRKISPLGVALKMMLLYCSLVVKRPGYFNTYSNDWERFPELSPVFPGEASKLCWAKASMTSSAEIL